jgi:pyruvate formate lyase activating enzyme
MHGIVFDIQRFCLHDGPGIRTTVFLKGCSLRCIWCHNPESMRMQPQADRHGRVIGESTTVDEVLAVVERDRPYYERSGGGITLSGGEPLVQFPFVRDLMHEAKRRGFQLCLETAGHVPQRRFEAVLPDVDMFLYDVKAHDSTQHKDLTSQSNRQILANLDYLCCHGACIRLRCPLIPGVNDTHEHLQFIAELTRRYPMLDGVEIMPYHNMAAQKWEAIGLPHVLAGRPSASEEQRRQWLQTLADLGGRGVVVS